MGGLDTRPVALSEAFVLGYVDYGPQQGRGSRAEESRILPHPDRRLLRAARGAEHPSICLPCGTKRADGRAASRFETAQSAPSAAQSGLQDRLGAVLCQVRRCRGAPRQLGQLFRGGLHWVVEAIHCAHLFRRASQFGKAAVAQRIQGGQDQPVRACVIAAGPFH